MHGVSGSFSFFPSLSLTPSRSFPRDWPIFFHPPVFLGFLHFLRLFFPSDAALLSLSLSHPRGFCPPAHTHTRIYLYLCPSISPPLSLSPSGFLIFFFVSGIWQPPRTRPPSASFCYRGSLPSISAQPLPYPLHDYTPIPTNTHVSPKSTHTHTLVHRGNFSTTTTIYW